jgi:hypothetical protein
MYRVNGILGDGRKVPLVTGSLEKDQALFISRALKKRLGLKKAPVVGELL